MTKCRKFKISDLCHILLLLNEKKLKALKNFVIYKDQVLAKTCKRKNV